MLKDEVTIRIPGQIGRALPFPGKEIEARLRLELAVHLYEELLLSFGKAAELAQKSQWEFAEELAGRKIARHYNEEDLKEDIEFAEAAGVRDGGK